MRSWQIGDVRVTKFVELEINGSIHQFLLPEATPEDCKEIDWLRPHFMETSGELSISVHSFVVETPTCRIIVDTCLGNNKKRPVPTWNMLSGPFLSNLQKAGLAADSFDYVVCTHLHVDHVGWNTMWDGQTWKPTFSRARYIITDPEFAYWRDNREQQQFGDYFSDSVRPITDAGLVELVETNHGICEEVRLESTPGHSPGHVSVRISSRGKEALISGDFIHHPCQMAHPSWFSTADYDRQLAVDTRRRMLTQLANDETLLIGTHFVSPTAGYVVREGETWRLDTNVAG